MALTTIATGFGLTQKLQSEILFFETKDEMLWTRFMSKKGDSIIYLKEELEKEAGDSIAFGLLSKLVNDAVIDDAQLEGLEEEMILAADTVTLQQRRNAVALAGRMSEKRVRFNLRESGRRLLSQWNAEDANQRMFTLFESAPTKTFFPNAIVATSGITSADKINLSDISRIKAFAKSTASPRIPGVMVDGRPMYVLAVHSHVLFDLKEDPRYEQLARETLARQAAGAVHPIRLGAVIEHDGVIIHEHPDVATSTTFGPASDQPGATNSFLGRNAGCFAWGDIPKIVDNLKDYGNQYRAAVTSIWGFSKSNFSANDLAYIQYTTFRTDLV